MPQTGNGLILSGGQVRAKNGSPSANPVGGHHWIRVMEVTHGGSPETVWEAVVDDPACGWVAYRIERQPLYP